LEGLDELAETLIASFDEHGHLEDLHEAVSLHREALESRPPGHSQRVESLHRLGRLLCRRECQSWTEALDLYHKALTICSVGSPLRADLLSDTSTCFLDLESPFFDLSQGIKHLSDAYSDNFCHVNRRLRSAMSDLHRVELAYNAAATSLDPFTLEQCSGRVVDLYAQVISLLPRAANFGLDHKTRLQAVSGLDTIVRDAAARALSLERDSQAIEMLEERRGVFWAQSLHLRSSAFDDVPQEERQELQRLLRLLEYSGRVENSEQNTAERERDLERRRQLNEEVETLIVRIRACVGLDRFLLPPTFDGLISALPDGYMVIVNSSALGYHALLLQKGAAFATTLKLQPHPTGFDSEFLRSVLPRDTGPSTLEGQTRAMRKVRDQGGSFLDMLSVLWTSIVRPVITSLGLQVSFSSSVREYSLSPTSL
jgi:hypothetical protein